MHFKWILLISSCLILSVSAARKVGGKGVSRGATSFRRPSASSALANSPRFSSSPGLSGRGPRRSSLNAARGASSPATNGPVSQAVVTPLGATSNIMRIRKRNSTNSNSQNRNGNISKAGNTTAEANLSKLALNPLQAGKNSTGDFKSGVNAAKGNAFNSTIKGSAKNATTSGSMIVNAAGRNVTGNAMRNGTINGTTHALPGNSRNVTGNVKLNGTLNGFPQVVPGDNTKRNFTLSPIGSPIFNGSLLANHTRVNNTRNATGNGMPAGGPQIPDMRTSPIANFPWEGGVKAGGNPQQTANNNMSPFDNPPQMYDNNNGNAPRVPRNNLAGDIAKTIAKNVASKPNSPKLAKQNSAVTTKNWSTNRSIQKSSVNKKSPSVILIAVSVILYFCNIK